MANYTQPVWKMVKEAVEELVVADTNGVIQYIQNHYPDDSVKIGTIRSHMIACAINHPSTIHYIRKNRPLYYLGEGKYEIYDPGKHGKWTVGPDGLRRIDINKKGEKSKEIPYSRISMKNQIKIPEVIMKRLDLQPNDIVAFIEKKDEIIMKKGSLSIKIV